MQEKKLSNGVIRIRMNTCTILALIILPFLLFMLYVILFSECSELLKKSGLYSFNQPGSESDEKIGEYMPLTKDNDNDIDLDKTMYSKKLNEIDVEDKSNDTDTGPKIPVVFRIVQLLLLQFSAESSDDKKSSGVEPYEDKEYDHSISKDSEGGNNNAEIIGEFHPTKVVTTHEASTQTDPERKPEGEEIKTEKENVEDEGEEEKIEKGYASGILIDASQAEGRKDDAVEGLKQTFSKPLDGDVKPEENKTASATDVATVDKNESNDDDDYEYNPLYGPVYSYNYDSWDFSIPNTLVCPKNGDDMYLLILIHSSVRNFEQRKAIRETWGRIGKLPGINYAFILGIAADNHLDNQLKHESDTHHDIILTDLADMEINETPKSVLSFKWLMYYCPKVKYVFKTNDNVFVNLPQLALFLQDKDTIDDDVMYGFLYEGFKPERDSRSPNYITRKEFAGDVYPDYLASEGYIFPGKFAPTLFQTALKMKYFPIENIFVTGFLAEKLKIPRKDVPLFSATFPDLPKKEKCNILSYIIVFHPLNSQGMRFFWNELQRTGFKCGDFMENVKKMIPKNESMYSSNINDKLLYALLAGESIETIENSSGKNEELNQLLIGEKTNYSENTEFIRHERTASSETPMNKDSLKSEETDNVGGQKNKETTELVAASSSPQENKETSRSEGAEGIENFLNKENKEQDETGNSENKENTTSINDKVEINPVTSGKDCSFKINIILLIFSFAILKFIKLQLDTTF